MRKIKHLLGATIAAAGLFGLGAAAQASSHREAPAIALDPAADNTDLWAWTSSDKQYLYVVAAYNPLEEPAGGPNFNKFADEVLYEIHITPGNDNHDKLIYQFQFHTSPITRNNVADLKAGPGGGKEFFAQLSLQKQTYSVAQLDLTGDEPLATSLATNVPVAPTNFGPRTQAVSKALGLASSDTYNDAFAATFVTNLSGGGRVWAGPRDDGFYVDLGGVFDLANLRPKGTAQNGVYHFNCHAIALAIPTSQLTANGQPPGNTPGDNSTIGVWASASRRQVSVLNRNGTNTDLGPYVQVSRLALPLINEAVVGLQDKDKYNRTRPPTDVANFGAYILNPIIVRDAQVVGQYSACAQGAPTSTCQLAGIDPTPFMSNRSDIIDVVSLKNIPAAGTHNVPLAGFGDILRVDMALDAKTYGYPNGRPLGPQYNKAANQENDVTDITLSLFLAKLTKPVTDGVDYNDANYLSDLPFLALPWRGYDQGHGMPTP